MSSRRCRGASNAPFHIVQPDRLAAFDGSGDGHHRAHRSQTVLDGGSVLRSTIQNCLGKSFDLPLVTVGVFAERAMKLPVLCREAFDVARFMKPRQINVALHT